VKELLKAVAVESDPPQMTQTTAEFWSGRDGVCGAASAITGVREFFHTFGVATGEFFRGLKAGRLFLCRRKGRGNRGADAWAKWPWEGRPFGPGGQGHLSAKWPMIFRAQSGIHSACLCSKAIFQGYKMTRIGHWDRKRIFYFCLVALFMRLGLTVLAESGEVAGAGISLAAHAPETGGVPTLLKHIIFSLILLMLGATAIAALRKPPF
jgi:hypothetical protein